MMPLEQQVPKLEYCQRLKELGFPQESLFSWVRIEKKWSIGYLCAEKWIKMRFAVVAAPTVAELAEMFPYGARYFPVKQYDGKWSTLDDKAMPIAYEENEADARAKVLIYFLEQKLIDPSKLGAEEKRR